MPSTSLTSIFQIVELHRLPRASATSHSLTGQLFSEMRGCTLNWVHAPDGSSTASLEAVSRSPSLTSMRALYGVPSAPPPVAPT